MDIYKGSSFNVDAETEDILQEQDVTHGCSLRPGLRTPPLWCTLISEDLRVRSLSIVASSERDIRKMLDRMEEFAGWTKLTWKSKVHYPRLRWSSSLAGEVIPPTEEATR